MNGKKESDKKICFECSRRIEAKDKQVSLNTYDNGKAIELTDFHFPCFVDYFNKRVENKAKANIKQLQEKAMSIFNSPMLKSLLSQIAGSDIALNMLKTPINVDQIVSKQLVKRKIQNGRKRKGKK